MEAKKKAKKERSRKLESCLTITRAYYTSNKAAFDAYVKEHKSAKVDESMEEGPEMMALKSVAQ